MLKAETREWPDVSPNVGPRYPSSIRAELSRAHRILLIRLRSLGDSILTLPLVEALREWRPELQLDVLIESPYSAVFSRHPAIHETLVLKPRYWPAKTGWSKGRALLELRRRRYSVAINLHGGRTSLLFTIASGARLRIGEERYQGSWAYNSVVPSSARVWKREAVHTAEHQLTLLRWLEIPIPDKPGCTLYVDNSACERLRERLVRLGISWHGFFLIHPTATLYTKQWPAAHFAQVGDQLHKQYGLPVIFTSASTEAQVLLDIGKCAGQRHHYWSDLALDELFALIDGCRLFVGNDSGPTHAAAALHKPVVVVWGSSNFKAWHPWGTDYEFIRSDLPCMPCPGYTCAAFGKPKCILEIPVESVLQACHRILDRT